MNSTRARRPTYHHGDLRNALIDAGARLAEDQGPDAVGIRPAARIVGVTPTAAYRHFTDADELLEAVCDRAFATLTDAMRDGIADVDTGGSQADQAIQRLRAIGRAYIRVALTEPGLYRAAFNHQIGMPPLAVDGRSTAFGILSETLDNLVTCGLLPAERRPAAEIAAWSSVHGFARLVLDGPISELSDDAVAAASERVIDMVTHAFSRP